MRPSLLAALVALGSPQAPDRSPQELLATSPAGVLATSPADGPPARLRNARLETRILAGSLAAAVRSEGRGPAWVGYSVASLRSGHRCCFDSREDALVRPLGGCRLEGGRRDASFEDGGTVALEAPATTAPVALVLLRVEDGRVGRVAAYSADCALDAGGRRVLWLSGVPAAESLALLEPLVTSPPTGAGETRREADGRARADEVLAAVAAHADSEADAVLDRQAADGRPAAVREQAVFWMGEARGRRGYDTLRRLVRGPDEGKFREQVVFALSLSDVPEATDTLVETARNDRDREVRGQALFWLAQKAGQKAKAAITHAIDDDPDLEVKKKAVFALFEMKDGVPLLIQVARSHRDPAIREQAFFWLGQSEDEKALGFLAEVLARP
jgi:hypothetical protein